MPSEDVCLTSDGVSVACGVAGSSVSTGATCTVNGSGCGLAGSTFVSAGAICTVIGCDCGLSGCNEGEGLDAIDDR